MTNTYVTAILSHCLYITEARDLLLLNCKFGSFPGNKNLDHQVTTEYSLSLLDQASATENLTAEKCFVVDLVH